MVYISIVNGCSFGCSFESNRAVRTESRCDFSVILDMLHVDRSLLLVETGSSTKLDRELGFAGGK